LPPKHEKCREIPREFDLTAVQSHPRSSILVSMESPYMTSYLSSIVTLTISATVFEKFTLKNRKLLILSTSPCLTPRSGEPLEFLDETQPTKTRGMGLPYGENFIILSSAVFEILAT